MIHEMLNEMPRFDNFCGLPMRSRVPIDNFGATIKDLFVVALLAHGVRPTEDGVQRRAQFVRDKSGE
jgi:hypothetical protein